MIVLTSFLDDERLMPALQAGAAGYLLKDVEPAELARAVRSACADEALIDPTVAARLLHTLSSRRPRRAAPPRTAIEHLTRREREVLELIALGHSNKRIALELGVAEKTVKTHVGHLLAKLGVADRTQAALPAVAVQKRSDAPGPRTNYRYQLETAPGVPSVACPQQSSPEPPAASDWRSPGRWRDRGWRLVIDARGAPELQRAATELEAITHVRALPGDVADDWHRGALVDAAGERDRPARQQRQHARRPARSRSWPPIRWTTLQHVYDVNVIAPLALAQLALPLMPAGGVHRQRHLRRRRRALRGLGRLRVLEGGARAADRDPRRRAAASCACTRSTPATCARRCTRRRSPARTSPTGRRPRRAFPGCSS